MSASLCTEHFRFPSGRSVKKIKQDARSNKTLLNELAAVNGIDMPWRWAIDYLKDKDHLQLKGNIVDSYEKVKPLPGVGGVNFLVGTPGSFITQSALKALMLVSQASTIKQIGYIDYSCAGKNKPPSSQFLAKSLPYLDGAAGQRYLDELEQLKVAWEKSFEFVRRSPIKFVSAKAPKMAKLDRDKDAMFISINPRKAVIGDLAHRLNGASILVADNRNKSILGLGGAGQWGQLHSENTAMNRRTLLGSTNTISEQRVIGHGDKQYLLRRSVSPSSAQKKDFLDKSVGIYEPMIEVALAMNTWTQEAELVADKQNLQGNDKDKFINKAKSFDTYSDHHLDKIVNQYSASTTARKRTEHSLS